MNKTQLKELIKKSHMKEGSTVPWLNQDKNTSEATLDALESKLKSHNWFHYQSDGRVYDEGMAQKKEIQDMLKALEGKGLGDAAKELYNKYAPYEEGGVNLRMKEAKKSFPEDGKETRGTAIEKNLDEGTWSTGTYTEIKRFVSDLDMLKDKYYNIVGSDDVFDGLDRAATAAEELMRNAPENRGELAEDYYPSVRAYNVIDGDRNIVYKNLPRHTAIEKAGEREDYKFTATDSLAEYKEEDEDLTLTFKDENEFERAKEHFESNSEFHPEYINDEFKSFHFKVQDQADADSTEYYLTQELEGTTDLDGYFFALEPSMMNEKKKSFPDMTGDGEVTKADILKARGVDLKEEETALKIGSTLTKNGKTGKVVKVMDDMVNVDFGNGDVYGIVKSRIKGTTISEDLDVGHEDNEPHMLKADLYRIGKYAMELYQMVDEFEGKGEVDFPHWWQSKIINAKSNLVGAKHYLDFEIKEPAIDAMVGVASDEEILDDEPMMENIGKYVVRPCSAKGTPFAVWKTSKGGENDKRIEGFKTEEDAKAFADKKNKAMNEAKNSVLSKLLGTKA
jgi:hypothetical protein